MVNCKQSNQDEKVYNLGPGVESDLFIPKLLRGSSDCELNDYALPEIEILDSEISFLLHDLCNQWAEVEARVVFEQAPPK